MGPSARHSHVHDGDISDRAYQYAVLAATLAFTAVLLVWMLITPPFRGLHEHEAFNAVLQLEYADTWASPGDAVISQGVWDAMQEAGFAASLPRSDAQWGVEKFASLTPPAEYTAIDAENAIRPAEAVAIPDNSGVDPPLYYWIQATAATTADLEGTSWHTQLQFARFINVLMAMWIPALVAAAAKHISTKKWAAATAAFIPLSIPELAHITTVVGSTVGFVVAALSLTAAVTLVMHHGPSWRRTALVGVVYGLGMLMHAVIVFMLPLILAGFVLARPASKWRSDLARAGAAIGIAFFVGGIWWVSGASFGQVVSGTERASPFLEESRLGGLTGESVSFWEFIAATASDTMVSFWGSFSYFEVSFVPVFAFALSLIFLAGIAIGVIYARVFRIDSIVLAGFCVYVALALSIVEYARYQDGIRDGALAGRFLFIILGSAAAVFALGIAKAYAAGHVEDSFPMWLPTGSLGVGLFGLLTAFMGFYNPLNETLGQAIGRWAEWTPGGMATVSAVLVMLALVVVTPIVVNYKLLKPRNWSEDLSARRND